MNHSQELRTEYHYLEAEINCEITVHDLYLRYLHYSVASSADVPCTDEEWEVVQHKGIHFRKAFDMSNEKAEEYLKEDARLKKDSQLCSILGFGDLDLWNWKSINSHTDKDEFERHGVACALQKLGKSDKPYGYGGDIMLFELRHGYSNGHLTELNKQTYRGPDGESKRVTGATYHFGVETKNGTIITMNIESPKHVNLRRTPPVPQEQMPKLPASSDVIWSMWQKHSSPVEVKNLQWWFSAVIMNQQTRRIIKRAIQGCLLAPWPGEELNILADERGQAILGSLIGLGLAWFLLQHKVELGNMYAARVHVFSGHGKWCVAFEIKKPQEAQS